MKTILTTLIFLANCAICFALPQGEQVVSGNASFSQNGNTLNINQTSDKLIADYNSFSISANEAVHFIQPSAASQALNRVTGANPSNIFGQLTATGQIFLINPNGILFGPASHVDTAGLVASTLNITNDDFLNGHLNFSNASGDILNEGHLNSPGGYIALLGNHVGNNGSIDAQLGNVVLASGNAITLNLDSQGVMSVALSEGLNNGEVNNLGLISADGGHVALSARTLDGVLKNAVNNSGIISATHLTEQNGEIILSAEGSGASLVNSGTLNGGDVTIEAGRDITHETGGDVSTSGGNLRGKAGRDYIVGNGVTINAGEGILDIYAGRNIVLGSPDEETVSRFNWEYVSGERFYDFQEFGYFYFDGNNIVYVPLTEGHNIGMEGNAPLSGSGTLQNILAGLYAEFDRGDTNIIYPSDTSGVNHWRYHTEPALNEDRLNHVMILGNQYSWEDVFGLGNSDFNDAVLNFSLSQTTIPAGAFLKSENKTFLTADQGFIRQNGGLIDAPNVMLSANTGITGTAANNGLIVHAENISALNKTSGDIRIHNNDDLMIENLTNETGINTGVTGQNGITNDASGGTIDIASNGDISINAPIHSKGDIHLKADGKIVHTANGDITIDNSANLELHPPKDVQSPSHNVGTWSNNKNIDITWRLPDQDEGCCGSYSAEAGGNYTMGIGSSIFTDSGNATIVAGNDIAVTIIDAQNGTVSLTSQNGSIIDNDLGTRPTDFDIIAHTIQMRAPNGEVGGSGQGEEIDLGYPFAFSFLFDVANNTIPNSSADTFDASLDHNGEWLFSTSFMTPFDSDNWWFHIKTVDEFHHLSSSSVHLGPFMIDTIAPVITAGTPQGTPGPNGTFLSDVTVPFSATDERSGFAPNGQLQTDLGTQTTSAENNQLILNSGGVSDLAGNFTPGVSVGFQVVTFPNPGPFPTTISTFELQNNLLDFYRAYYEILSPSQFLSFEPATKIGLFAYHPITETDSTAMDFALDADAYEFIQNNIELKKKLPSYFGE
jgi:filamentous hemagglutinin family protein